MYEDDSDYELELDRLLPVYEGDVVEDGDKGGPAKNILDKKRYAFELDLMHNLQ